MALFIGKNNNSTELIARFGVSIEYIQQLIGKYVDPTVGELRYSATIGNFNSTMVKNGAGVYVPTADFDGWAYPDSSIKLYKENFLDAWNLYHVDASNVFSLPNITTTLKAVGNLTDGLTFKSKQICIPPHNHKMTNRIDGTVRSSSIKLPSGLAYISSSGNRSGADAAHYENRTVGGQANVKLPRFHNGNPAGGAAPVPLDITMKISDTRFFFNDLETNPTPAAGTGEDFILPHFTVPLLLYIGKPTL